MSTVDLRNGDCLDILKTLPDNSVDAVVTDPPYGLSNTNPSQVADALTAWVTGDDAAVPGLKRDSLDDAFVKALKVSPVRNADNLDTKLCEQFVSFRIPLGVIPVSMFRPVDFNNNTLGGEEKVDRNGSVVKVEHLLGHHGEAESGEGFCGNVFSLRRRSSTPGTVSRKGDSALVRVSIWLDDGSPAKAKSAPGVVASGATEVVAVLSLDMGRGTAEFLPADSALPGDFVLQRSSSEFVGALAGTGGLSPMSKSGDVRKVSASADGADTLDVVVELASGWHKSHTSTSKGFMGKSWDGFVPPPAVWKECLRVLKPGGHMAVFAGARTQDLMGLSIRLAGFEIRDTLGWIYGSGFPKSLDVSKAIDKGSGENKARQYEFTEWMRSTGITARQIDEATGTKMGSHYTTHPTQPAIATADLFDKLRPLLPEVPERIERLVAERTGIEWTDYVKREVVGGGTSGKTYGMGGLRGVETSTGSFDITSSHSDAARQWEGWGTALKPAIEPIILARKPLEGTVAANVLAHGVGGLNIDATRVGMSDADREAAKVPQPVQHNDARAVYQMGTGEGSNGTTFEPAPAGRFPANVVLDDHAAAEMDKQSGFSVSRANTSSDGRGAEGSHIFASSSLGRHDPSNSHNDSGGASRFFPVFKYQAKAPKRERPVIVREDGTKIQHPTVKPLELMKWLVRLTCPPGGTVLEPFAGSGTTVQAARDEGFDVIGIEQDPEYIELIRHRLESNPAPEATDDDPVLF